MAQFEQKPLSSSEQTDNANDLVESALKNLETSENKSSINVSVSTPDTPHMTPVDSLKTVHTVKEITNTSVSEDMSNSRQSNVSSSEGSIKRSNHVHVMELPDTDKMYRAFNDPIFKKADHQIALPSKGLLYEGKVPNGVIRIKPMTAREERILAGSRSGAKSIASILQNCISAPIPVQDLLLSDRLYALMRIRGISYGSKYSFIIKCQSCDLKIVVDYNVGDDIPVNVLPDGASEPFFTKLPVSSHVIGFRLLRGKDEDEIARYSDRVFSRGVRQEDGDPTYVYRLALNIVSIDGKEYDVNARMAYVEQMVAADSLALREAIDEHEPGPDMQIIETCPRCGFENETMLQFTNEFFRPRAR
ncbi:MAG: hypothetical protein QW303_09230 [Nitrososphaerota archaeon]